MIQLYEQGAYVIDGVKPVPVSEAESPGSTYRDTDGKPLTEQSRRDAARNTVSYSILHNHDHSQKESGQDGPEPLRIVFDSLTSHDITYVGIIQTARAASRSLTAFPMPYVLSNCHNSLCAVGGTINEDDHLFGLMAAKKYGGVYVPTHLAVIHQYMREMMATCGGMILGSDSHTRYGALGTMGVGEGGGELVKQLLGRTYDIPYPEVVGVYLTGTPQKGVGPQDVALAIIGAVFAKGYVKNKVLEFFGDGVDGLSVEYRMGIDVMTTETTCLTSIWVTDAKVEEYYAAHGRADAYKTLKPGGLAYYDGMITVDLTTIKPMIAMPYHPSHVYEIDTLCENAVDIAYEIEKGWKESGATGATSATGAGFDLRSKLVGGQWRMDQGVIAGCAGGMYENICEAAAILDGSDTGSGAFSLSVYPASQPVSLTLTENGVAAKLMRSGAVIRTAFCGPCFGAGDVPCHNGLSIRHATRNFPNREGSKPGSGQSAAVALMDARSIAATARNGGILTAASDADYDGGIPKYYFNRSVYDARVYNGYGKADPDGSLTFGPGIRDWPAMDGLTEQMLLRVDAFITDPVTTTDELIPSGETSSYRSNPEALAEFTLSRKDPGYVGRAKETAALNKRRLAGESILDEVYTVIRGQFPIEPAETAVGSVLYAVKPGDGSAREQAASCQRVLGGTANIAREYATKRYRSNLVNWGLLPFVLEGEPVFQMGDYLLIPGVRSALMQGKTALTAYVVRDTLIPFNLMLPALTADEAEIIISGGLINYYRADGR